MVAGRLRKTLSELSLVEQPFVKDPKTTVGKLLADSDARCLRLVRFDVGTGEGGWLAVFEKDSGERRRFVSGVSHASGM